MESDMMEFTTLSLFIWYLIGYYGMACEIVASWQLNNERTGGENHNFNKLMMAEITFHCFAEFFLPKIKNSCELKSKLMQIENSITARHVCITFDSRMDAPPFVYLQSSMGEKEIFFGAKTLINKVFLTIHFLPQAPGEHELVKT